MLRDIVILLLPALLVFAVLWARRRAPAKEPAPPPRAIVVDGSNVLHWGGDPAVGVLQRVVRALQDMGYAPIVYFDANVGYLLADRFHDAAAMARIIDLPPSQVHVVDRGVVADEAILHFAAQHRLRVVTNDRYRDWRVRFPWAAQKGTLVGGHWREGSVVWRGKL